MGDTTTQDSQPWVSRVLGIDPLTAGPTISPQALDAARKAWTAAMDTADSQITGLQQALLATDDGDLHDIAEYGLSAVTGDFRVPMMAALAEADPASKPSLAKLAKTVAQLSNHLATDDRVMVCDENSFGVAVSLRATLGAALGELQRSLTPQT
jgi:hypothetical protein